MALEEKVGLRIKSYREALGLTPETLAEKCGVDVSTVKRTINRNSYVYRYLPESDPKLRRK